MAGSIAQCFVPRDELDRVFDQPPDPGLAQAAEEADRDEDDFGRSRIEWLHGGCRVTERGA